LVNLRSLIFYFDLLTGFRATMLVNSKSTYARFFISEYLEGVSLYI
jgi:hypothetical protein